MRTKFSQIAIFLLLASVCALSQTTTTITGTIRDLSQALVTSGKVTFALQPSRDTTISGYARFSPQTITCAINASGLIKAQDGVSVCTLTMNTALQPTGTYYLVKVWPANVATSTFTFYAVLSTYDWSTVVPTPTTSPAQNFVDIFSNQTIGGNKTWTGTQTFSGTFLGSAAWQNTTITGTLDVSGAMTAASTLAVAGALSSAVSVAAPTVNASSSVNATTGYKIGGSYGTNLYCLQSTGTGTIFSPACSPGGTPTITLGTGAGVGATYALTVGSKDKLGSIQINTGTGPVATLGTTVFQLTFGTPFSTIGFCTVNYVWTNSNVNPNSPIWSAGTGNPMTSGFYLVASGSALTASQAYVWTYLCNGY